MGTPLTASVVTPSPQVPPRASDDAALQLLLFSGLRREIAEQEARPLPEHLAKIRLVLARRGKKKSARAGYQKTRTMIRLCRASVWGHFNPSTVEAAAGKLQAVRAGRARLSNSTVNAYIGAFKAFCRWMTSHDRAERDPCRRLVKLKKRPVRKRRRLTYGEILRLITAANEGPTIAHIPGAERALTYIIATTTGYRSKEIQSLTPASFSDRAFVRLAGEHTKNGDDASIPSRPDVMKLVDAHIAATPPGRQLFRRPRNGMYSMRKDLAAAGIEYCVDGRHADFHALRKTFVTDLFATGATPKDVQAAARHGDARLTLAVYADTEVSAQRTAIESLRSVCGPMEAERAAELPRMDPAQPPPRNCPAAPGNSKLETRNLNERKDR